MWWSEEGREGRERRSCGEYLQERLPEYMVPGQYVRLEELPLTANGKMDRRAIAGGWKERGMRREEYEAPGRRDGEDAGGIWAEVLKMERVGRHDNFFDLGATRCWR